MTTQAQKQLRQEKRDVATCELIDLCETNGLEFEFITPYQIRIEDKLDVFPTSRKCNLFKAHPSRYGTYLKTDELIKLLR